MIQQDWLVPNLIAVLAPGQADIRWSVTPVWVRPRRAQCSSRGPGHGPKGALWAAGGVRPRVFICDRMAKWPRPGHSGTGIPAISKIQRQVLVEGAAVRRMTVQLPGASHSVIRSFGRRSPQAQDGPGLIRHELWWQIIHIYHERYRWVTGPREQSTRFSRPKDTCDKHMDHPLPILALNACYRNESSCRLGPP